MADKQSRPFRLTALRRALGKANALPDDAGGVLADLQRRLGDVERELVRVSPQLAALEARVEDVRARLDSADVTGSPEEVAQARSVLDEVRTEHARVRARISAATVFEERLRVLEERSGQQT